MEIRSGSITVFSGSIASTKRRDEARDAQPGPKRARNFIGGLGGDFTIGRVISWVVCTGVGVNWWMLIVNIFSNKKF
jgi:hypothetical protein